MNIKQYRMIGIFVIIFITLFQGITLILFRSSACEQIPLLDEVTVNPVIYLFISLLYPNNCVMTSGTIINIVAIVFWFITGSIMILFGPPLDD